MSEEDDLFAEVVEVLIGNLSNNDRERQQAEDQINEWLEAEDFGVMIADVIVAGDEVAVEVRRLAASVLKVYIREHWSPISENFVKPECTPEGKAHIREALPYALGDPNELMRTAVGMCVGAISIWDYPGEWPEIFDDLLGMLAEGDEYQVEGAIRALSLITGDITNSTVVNVLSSLSPILLRIATGEEGDHPAEVRRRAVGSVYPLLATLTGMHSVDPQLVEEELTRFMKDDGWSEVFAELLQVPNTAEMDDDDKLDPEEIGVKIQCLKCVNVILMNTPELCRKQMTGPIHSVYKSLQHMIGYFQRYLVEEMDDEVCRDSDGESYSCSDFIRYMMEFMHALVSCGEYNGAIKNAVSDMIYNLQVYMQLTAEQVEEYDEHPDVFAEEDDEDNLIYSTRTIAQQLVIELVETYESVGSWENVEQHIQTRMQESEEMRNNEYPEWWQIREACYFCVGTMAKNWGESPVGLEYLLEELHKDLSEDTPELLMARVLTCATELGFLIGPDAMSAFVQASIDCIVNAETAPVVRICACRSLVRAVIHEFVDEQELFTFATDLMESLLRFADESEGDTQLVALETLSIMLGINGEATLDLLQGLVDFMFDLWNEHYNNPFMIAEIVEVLRLVSRVEECADEAVNQIVPRLIEYLENPKQKTSVVYSTIDLIGRMIEVGPQPMNPDMITELLPLVTNALQEHGEGNILQTTADMLRMYLLMADEELLYMKFQDDQGETTLLEVIVEFTKMLLSGGNEDDEINQHTIAYVGPLLTRLFRSFGMVMEADVRDELLEGTLDCLDRADRLELVQGLVLVHVNLILHPWEGMEHAHVDWLLAGDGGRFEVLIVKWLQYHAEFFGDFYTKFATIALTHLFAGGIEALETMQVNGLPKSNGKIVTRSQRLEYERIPALQRIFWLLAHAYSEEVNQKTKFVDYSDVFGFDNLSDMISGPDVLKKSDDREKNAAEQSARQVLNNLLTQMVQEEEDEVKAVPDYDVVEHKEFRTNLAEYLAEFFVAFGTDAGDLFYDYIDTLRDEEMQNVIVELLEQS